MAGDDPDGNRRWAVADAAVDTKASAPAGPADSRATGVVDAEC